MKGGGRLLDADCIFAYQVQSGVGAYKMVIIRISKFSSTLLVRYHYCGFFLLAVCLVELT